MSILAKCFTYISLKHPVVSYKIVFTMVKENQHLFIFPSFLIWGPKDNQLRLLFFNFRQEEASAFNQRKQSQIPIN